jgi:hypothetical protein
MTIYILENPLMICFMTILILFAIYIFARIIAFGIVKSFYQGRMSFYQNLKNKIKKENKK